MKKPPSAGKIKLAKMIEDLGVGIKLKPEDISYPQGVWRSGLHNDVWRMEAWGTRTVINPNGVPVTLSCFIGSWDQAHKLLKGLELVPLEYKESLFQLEVRATH
jgi:hypothetical protein